MVDDRGRTLCAFKLLQFSEDDLKLFLDGPPSETSWWTVVSKPPSAKSMEAARAESAAAGRGGYVVNRHARIAPVTRQPGDVDRLDIPGLSLRWDKVTTVLDGLAEEFSGPTLTLTVVQFRRRVT